MFFLHAQRCTKYQNVKLSRVSSAKKLSERVSLIRKKASSAEGVNIARIRIIFRAVDRWLSGCAKPRNGLQNGAIYGRQEREREGEGEGEEERRRNNASISPRSGNDHDYDRSRFNRRYFTSIFTILRRGPLLTSLNIPNHPLDFFFSIPLRLPSFFHSPFSSNWNQVSRIDLQYLSNGETDRRWFFENNRRRWSNTSCFKRYFLIYPLLS